MRDLVPCVVELLELIVVYIQFADRLGVTLRLCLVIIRYGGEIVDFSGTLGLRL